MNFVYPDSVNQVDPVLDYISTFVVIADRALLMNIPGVVADLWRSCSRPVVAGMILAVVISAAADSGLVSVPEADIGIECCLGLFGVIALGLELFPGLFGFLGPGLF